MKYLVHLLRALVDSLMQEEPGQSETRRKLLNGLGLDPAHLQSLCKLCEDGAEANDPRERIVAVVKRIFAYKLKTCKDQALFLAAFCTLCLQDPADHGLFASIVVDGLLQATSPYSTGDLWNDAAQWYIHLLIKAKRYGVVGHLCRLADSGRYALKALEGFAPDGVFAVCRLLFGFLHGTNLVPFSQVEKVVEKGCWFLSNLDLTVKLSPSESRDKRFWALLHNPTESSTYHVDIDFEPRALLTLDDASESAQAHLVDLLYTRLCVIFATDSLHGLEKLLDEYAPRLSDDALVTVWKRFMRPEAFLQVDRQGVLFDLFEVDDDYQQAFVKIASVADFRRFGLDSAPFERMFRIWPLKDIEVRAALAGAASLPGACPLITGYVRASGMVFPNEFLSDLMIMEGLAGGHDLIHEFAVLNHWSPNLQGELMLNEIRLYQASRVLLRTVRDPRFPHLRPLVPADFNLFARQK